MTVQKDDRMANAASILGLMLLGAMQGEHLQLSASSPDAAETLQALAQPLGEDDWQGPEHPSASPAAG